MSHTSHAWPHPRGMGSRICGIFDFDNLWQRLPKDGGMCWGSISSGKELGQASLQCHSWWNPQTPLPSLHFLPNSCSSSSILITRLEDAFPLDHCRLSITWWVVTWSYFSLFVTNMASMTSWDKDRRIPEKRIWNDPVPAFFRYLFEIHCLYFENLIAAIFVVLNEN